MAQESTPIRASARKRSSALRRLISGFVVFILAVGLVWAALVSYLTQDRLTALAKEQIARIAGEGFETDINSANFRFLGNDFAGVKIDGISIVNAQTKLPLLKRGNASFSISLLSLLSGKIELIDLSISDAEMLIAAGDKNGSALETYIFGTDGLVDPKLVSASLEAAASAISTRLATNPDLVINAANIKLVFGSGDNAQSVLIDELKAAKSINNEFAFDAAISTAVWKTNLRGAVGQLSPGSKAADYRATLDPIPFNRAFTPQMPDLKPRNCGGYVGFAVASSNGLASFDTNVSKANCTLGTLGDYAFNAAIKGNLKRGSGVFEIGSGVINVNRSTFSFDGAIAPARYTPQPENVGETPRYRYELVFAPSTMDSLDNVDGPLAMTGKISGTFAPSEKRLALDEVIADAGGSLVRGAASLLFTDVTPALYLALTSDKIPVRDFKRLWPRFAAPTPRRIMMERLNGGTISNIRLELQLPPGKIGSRTFLERDQLTGSGNLESASFTTFGDLPRVRDAKGTVSFDGVEVGILLESGTAFLPSGREAALKPSSFKIADTHTTPVSAELNVAVEGKADALAEIAAQKPINAFANQDFSPDDISGSAVAKGVFQLKLVPRGQNAPLPDYQVNVELNDIALSKPIKGQTIVDASGTIKANNQQVDVRLDASLSGVPAKIIISEPRGAPEKRTQDIALTLSDDLRNKFAPGLKNIFRGPITARIKGSADKAVVELDLTKAALRIVPFNWEKGAGIGAKASFNFVSDGSDISISNLEISGRGLEATGTVQISNGELQSADLKNVRLNPGDNFSIGLKKRGENLSAILGGQQLDARALMKQMLPGRKPNKTLTSQALEVGGKIGRLVGFNNETVLNAEIGFTPGKNSALSLSGEFENGGAIDLSRTSGNNGHLIVQTGNAGAALRFVDLYKRMLGGTLATDFKIAEGGGLAGVVSISDFNVVGEPRLAKLTSEQAKGSASLAEATQADLAGEKASFELAQGDLTLEGGTIRLKRGIVRGPNVGATAEGIVLSATGQMDLRGTFMPARGLNRIVGAIPILGLFLGSGSKAGLIGITYRLAGDAKNPKVFVNPISLIAPGVFRQIFE